MSTGIKWIEYLKVQNVSSNIKKFMDCLFDTSGSFIQPATDELNESMCLKRLQFNPWVWCLLVVNDTGSL